MRPREWWHTNRQRGNKRNENQYIRRIWDKAARIAVPHVENMEIKGKKVMVLGGYGEVGFAICRQLVKESPAELIITSLREDEALAAIDKLQSETQNACKLIPSYGNLFVRWSLKGASKEEILSNSEYQRWLVEDAMEELNENVLTSSTLYKTITEHSPTIVVDCINTATGLAYQNVYQSYRELSEKLKTSDNPDDLNKGVYKLLSTLYIPLLVRHIQILQATMKHSGTSLYLKVGTTGTGGMGLNIPFTHGEEQPSRLLLSKTAVAGAQSLLLFLLSRTLGAPIVKELKPAALIGWKAIRKGSIHKAGNPIPLYDCPATEGYKLTPGESFRSKEVKIGKRIDGKDMDGVYVDTGENGIFSLDEFKAVSAMGLMQCITPEEIAQAALLEIKGVSTSNDVLGAIAGAVMGPTYRAGLLRQRVIKEMEGMGQDGIAYGLLGPRTGKLIFEAVLIKRCFGTLEKALQPLPKEMSLRLEEEVLKDQEIRSAAISLGLAVLLHEGETLLFANRVQRDKGWEQSDWAVTSENIEKWAFREWIDLRPKNMSKWQDRLRGLFAESQEALTETGSRFDRGSELWLRDKSGEIMIDSGEIVGWILMKEDL
jgi:hypothetical protein